MERLNTTPINPSPGYWFTSDMHFGHKSIIKHCPDTRGQCQTMEEHDAWLIKQFNSVVGKNEQVFILGDMFFYKDNCKNLEIAKQLNGRKTLVLGNHDYWIDENGADEVKACFVKVTNYLKVRIDKQFIYLFHFPITEWNKAQHGSFHLFGHVHGSLQTTNRSMDVGVDAEPGRDGKPYSWAEIYNRLKDRPKMPHHGRVTE